MTSEDDFQAQLDREPGDWQTRLVFADWLEERGDPRAEGYRALGVRRMWPTLFTMPGQMSRRWGWRKLAISATVPVLNNSYLPPDWLRVVLDAGLCPEQRIIAGDGGPTYRTRPAAESCIALAFAKLPPNRRAELLAGA